MEEIKEQVKSVVKDRGFTAALAAIAAGYIAKRFTNDVAGSIGAGLVAYAITKRV